MRSRFFFFLNMHEILRRSKMKCNFFFPVPVGVFLQKVLFFLFAVVEFESPREDLPSQQRQWISVDACEVGKLL